MDKPVFSVTISPHRSLSPAGLAVLLGLVALLNLSGGVLFWYLGAWPVIGFMGLDVVLVWLALHCSCRRSLRSENVTVTGAELQLSRYNDGRLLETLSFPRSFVYVDIERDEERDLIGRLLLRSKGRAYEIGSFLGAQQRLALERALQRALVRPKI